MSSKWDCTWPRGSSGSTRSTRRTATRTSCTTKASMRCSAPTSRTRPAKTWNPPSPCSRRCPSPTKSWSASRTWCCSWPPTSRVTSPANRSESTPVRCSSTPTARHRRTTMGDSMVGTSSFRLQDAPMTRDRTAGWAYVRGYGEVFEGDGAWYLTSADAVQYAQQHPELFSSARAFDSLGSPLPLIPIAMDPPAHVGYRRVLDPMLAPRVVNAMEEELRRQLGVLIDAFVERGSCDVVADFARLYPTQVFLPLFGLPLEDRDQFIEWADFIIEHAGVAATEPNEQVAAVSGQLFGYLQECVETKRRSPGPDMLSRILALSGERAWSNEEILGLCFLLTLAGLDTVTAEIGFVLFHLARDVELRRRVYGDPALVAPLIEEVVRLEPPAPI